MAGETPQQGIHNLVKNLVEGILKSASNKTPELEKTVLEYVSEKTGMQPQQFQEAYQLVSWYLTEETQTITPNHDEPRNKNSWKLKNQEQPTGNEEVERLTQEIIKKFDYWIKK